jgi:hypothetical protein
MKFKREVVCLVLLIFGLVGGATAQERPAFKPPRTLDLVSQLPLKPKGEFIVSVWREGTWREAGTLAYDRFIKEKSLDLSPYLAGAEEARVRITQRGGGAAHIDSVRLGGFPPERIAGGEAERSSTKLARLDHDLLDAAGRSFEVTFPSARADSTLTLAARVEGLKVDTSAFHFPGDNRFNEIGPSSRFYTYRMDSAAPPRAEQGGEPWRAAMKDRPFFKELSATCSGHPDGYTSGWVSNDGENLYVTLDFTPDNTCDGDKDYAAVHVRCAGQVKEFRVSEPEIRWGRAHFTYTAGVDYEHKVYEFVIPLGELGDAGRNGSLRLAFSAYGTAAKADLIPAMAYCPDTNQYLFVASAEVDDDQDIVGFILDNQGTVVNSLHICAIAGPQYCPDVAYDAASGRFLVVWQHFDDSQPQLDYDIFGQLVNNDGSLYGTNFAIASNTLWQETPAVANDSIHHLFFVVWAESLYENSDIMGLLVDSEGQLIGPTTADRADGSRVMRRAEPGGKAADDGYFIICDADHRQRDPDVAFNAFHDKYLVVFQAEYIVEAAGVRIQSQAQEEEYGIGGKYIDYDGSYSGSEDSEYFFDIADPWCYAYYPAVAADPVNGLFLVVWQDDFSEEEYSANLAAQPLQEGGWRIYGRLVQAEVVYPVDENLAISSNNPQGNINAALAFDSANENYLVVWKGSGEWNGDDYPDTIFGQLVPADGDLDPDEPDEILADLSVVYRAAPCLDFNSLCANFLVGWETTSYSYDLLVYGPPCYSGSDLPTVVTSPVTNISSTTAQGGGNVTSDGGSAVTARGVCWSATGTPTLSDPHTTNGTGVGAFVSQLTGLSSNTMYYVRAYAVNESGVGYGQVVSFTTLRQFTVTFLAGTGGVVNGQTVQNVPEGGDCTPVEAEADPGYFFLNWTGTGGFAATSLNPLTVTNVLQDMTITAHFGSLGLQAERREESAWIVKRYYAHLTITPSGLESLSGIRFVVSRKTAGGAYETIHEFTMADLEGGSFVYDDAFIEDGVAYTYKVTAFSADGRMLGSSLEFSL